jgi:hypothetical protein
MSHSKFAKPESFVRKAKNGKPNPKYVDLLDVDKPIAGQNFGCFSFITFQILVNNPLDESNI